MEHIFNYEDVMLEQDACSGSGCGGGCGGACRGCCKTASALKH